MTPRLPVLDNSNLLERTYAILKERIIKRQFDPRRKLSIPDIAEQLNVSRTPVRDAINRLEVEGLVITKPKVGTYIVPIDEELITSAIDTRMMIDLWVIRKLPECPAERFGKAIECMRAILDEAETAYRQQPHAYHEKDYNLNFHLAFIRSTGNTVLERIYLSAMNYRLPVTKPELVKGDEVKTALDQHREMLKSFAERDYAKLESSILEHLDDSKNRIIQKIQSNGGSI